MWVKVRGLPVALRKLRSGTEWPDYELAVRMSVSPATLYRWQKAQPGGVLKVQSAVLESFRRLYTKVLGKEPSIRRV